MLANSVSFDSVTPDRREKRGQRLVRILRATGDLNALANSAVATKPATQREVVAIWPIALNVFLDEAQFDLHMALYE